MTGKDRGADALAAMWLRVMIMTQINMRYPPLFDPDGLLEFPSRSVGPTDNPTGMRAARAGLGELLTVDGSVHQPFFFEWACFLPALSSRLPDACPN